MIVCHLIESELSSLRRRIGKHAHRLHLARRRPRGERGITSARARAWFRCHVPQRGWKGRTHPAASAYLFSLFSIIEGDEPLVQMDAQIKKRRVLGVKRILLRESLTSR